MPRYYSICEFTPSIKGQGSYMGYKYVPYSRVYENAPEGFLFCDTDKPLPLNDVILAMRELAALVDNPGYVLLLRVTDHQIVGTFSMRGIPMPTKIKTRHYDNTRHQYVEDEYDWLQRNELRGWLIRDITDPNSVIKPFGTDIFDSCPSLVRLSGKCPCAGWPADCVGVITGVEPSLTPEDLSTAYRIEPPSLRRVKYTNVAGFEKASSKATTTDDFAAALRPWDDYTFTDVEERKAVLSARGKRSGAVNKKRRAQCPGCVFVESNNRCADAQQCKHSVSEAEAWSHIYAWYNKSGFDNMKGFTEAQRNYLMRQAGKHFKGAVFSKRKTEAMMAGFHKGYGHNSWNYRVSACTGNRARSSIFYSYDDLLKVAPHLDPNPKLVTIPIKQRLAYALMASLERGKTHYSIFRNIHAIYFESDKVRADIASQRYTWTCREITYDAPITEYYNILRDIDPSFALKIKTVAKANQPVATANT